MAAACCSQQPLAAPRPPLTPAAARRAPGGPGRGLQRPSVLPSLCCSPQPPIAPRPREWCTTHPRRSARSPRRPRARPSTATARSCWRWRTRTTPGGVPLRRTRRSAWTGRRAWCVGGGLCVGPITQIAPPRSCPRRGSRVGGSGGARVGGGLCVGPIWLRGAGWGGEGSVVPVYCSSGFTGERGPEGWLCRVYYMCRACAAVCGS